MEALDYEHVDDDSVSANLTWQIEVPVMFGLDATSPVSCNVECHVQTQGLLQFRCSLVHLDAASLRRNDDVQHIACSVEGHDLGLQVRHAPQQPRGNNVPQNIVQSEELARTALDLVRIDARITVRIENSVQLFRLRPSLSLELPSGVT